MARITNLTNLCEGENGEIIQVRGKPEVHRFLYGMGLAMGRNVSNMEASRESASLTIKTGDKITTIERNMAQNIKVQVSR